MRRIALALALALGACSSGSPKPAASDPSTTADSNQTSQAPTSAPAGVDPNGPEVNPAGDIPDNQVFVVYTPPSGGFSVKVPEGWARTEAGGAVTFTDKLNRVRMETVAAASAPTVQSAQQQEVPAIQASVKRYEAGK